MKKHFRLLLPVVLLSLSCGALSQSGETVPTSPASTSAPPTLAATPAPPAYIPPQCAESAVATLPAATTVAEPTPDLRANPALSPQQQISVLDGLVNAVRDHYLYPEAVNDVWLAKVAEARSRIEAGLDTEAFYAEVRPLVYALGDEHSNFQSPAQISAEKAELAGIYNVVGVGVLFQPLQKGWATVLAVLEGGPAWYAGIQPHDLLLAVDGMPIGEPGKVHRTWTLGPECSAVVLTIQTPGQAPRDLMLIRWSVSAQLPIYPQLVPTSDGSRIGYIFLQTFLDESIPGRVRQALEDFGPLDGLILDNRMNGGGLGEVAEQILGFFTSGHVGDFVSREATEPSEIVADSVHNSQDVPLVVLVAEDTVSYGEVFSGILGDIGRARLVGQTTLGNVEQLREYDFEDGSRAWLASERFEPVNSQADWETTGIVPDVEVIAAWDTFTFETDPAIAAALELLGH